MMRKSSVRNKGFHKNTDILDRKYPYGRPFWLKIFRGDTIQLRNLPMKKIIVIMVLLCLVAVAGAYYVYYQPFDRKLTAEQVLPTDTLLTIRIEHLKQSIEKFRKSRLGTAITGIDVRSVLTALEAPAADIQKTEEFIAGVNASLNSSWFNALFGRQVTLAMLPTTISNFDSPSPEALSRALVLVMRPKHPAKFLDHLGQMIARDIEVSSEKYNRWEIKRFELEPGVNVHYTIVDNLVAMALNRRPVERCIDALGEPATSLAQNPDYQAVEREFAHKSDPEVYGFFNLQEIYQLATETVSNLLMMLCSWD